MLIIIRGIRNFNPAFSSPLLTNPKTSDARMSVTRMNTMEKYFTKVIEILTEDRVNGRLIGALTEGIFESRLVRTSTKIPDKEKSAGAKIATERKIKIEYIRTLLAAILSTN